MWVGILSDQKHNKLPEIKSFEQESAQHQVFQDGTRLYYFTSAKPFDFFAQYVMKQLVLNFGNLDKTNADDQHDEK